LAHVVIDASAVVAVLRNERGTSFISPFCAGALMSTVNLQEVIKALFLKGVSLEVAKDMIDKLQLNICPHSEIDAYAAAALIDQTRQHGSGLGDRTCMALAISRNLPALTTDRAWSQISIPGLQVILAR
jgi:ribonuclease VapC